MVSFQLLEQSQEDELHKIRLLNVEEKPFKRITKRLLTSGSLLSSPTTLPPTPPPEGTSNEAVVEAQSTAQKALDERRQFREEVLLDFAAFDSSIVRIQFLQNSNAKERERYAAEKIKIMETARDVKDNTSVLRAQLEQAQAMLNQRKKFDDLTEKITNNRLLRPREDQHINLHKLEEECRELEMESETYATTWKERREQFQRIVEEGEQMRRLIRDEKEEVERREGMEENEEDGETGENGSRGGQTPSHRGDEGGTTPRPDGANTPQPASGLEGRNTSHSEERSRSDGLRPRPLPTGSLSRPSSRVGSRQASPASSDRQPVGSTIGGDITMDEARIPSIETAADTHMSGVSGSLTEALENDIPKLQVTAAIDKMDTT